MDAPATPTPYTPERLTAVLTSLGLNSQPAEDASQGVLVGFTNMILQFTPAADTLHCLGRWRGQLDEDQIAGLIAGTAAFNTHQVIPTLSVQVLDGTLVVVMGRAVDVAFGLTDAQLRAWVATTIQQFGVAGQWLEENFPQAVDWTEGE